MVKKKLLKGSHLKSENETKMDVRKIGFNDFKWTEMFLTGSNVEIRHYLCLTLQQTCMYYLLLLTYTII